MVAFDEIRTVNVCMKCGRGFPDWVNVSSGIDTLQTWWIHEGAGSPACNGRISAIPRRAQIERVEEELFYAGAQWTPEQIATMKGNRDEREATSHARRSGGADILPAGAPEPGDPEEG